MDRENKNQPSAVQNVMDMISEKLRQYVSAYLPRDGEMSVEQMSGKTLLRAIGFGVLSFALSGAQFAMGSYPFGIAFFCSTHEQVIFCYLGMAIASLLRGSEAIPAFFMATIALGLRLGVNVFLQRRQARHVFFEEGTAIRAAIGETVVFLRGLYHVIRDGFLYYDLFGILFELATVPVFLILFRSVLQREKRYTLYYEAGIAALLGSIVFAVGDWRIFGYAIAPVVAFVLTLYISREGGMLRGCVTGLICGMGCTLAYAPLFATVGFLSGLLWQVGGLTATVVGGLSGIAFGFYIEGATALQTLAPELIVGIILFLPLVQFRLLPSVPLFTPVTEGRRTPVRTMVAVAERQERRAIKLQALSGALHELSDLFTSLSDRLRTPSLYEVRQSVTDTLQADCANCSLRARCWEGEYSRTVTAIDNISRTILRKASLTREDLPDWMQKECPRVEGIGAKMTLSYGALREQMRLRDKNDVIASDYEALARLVECAEEEDEEYLIDEALSEQAVEALRYLDLRAGTVAVFGQRRRTVVVGEVDLAHIRMSADALQKAFGNLCQTTFSPPRFDLEENGEDRYVTMTMTSTRQLTARYASASEQKEGETVNGDHMTSFENGEDYFYALLSDGMGSGREAALTSRICNVFLEKMLQAYNPKDLSIEMLSNLIRNKGSECFATLDLLEVDLLNGHACFIKSGAAPSFVLREGNLFRVTSNSMPIGITREINAEEIKFDLQPGDLIVMLSDGVAQGFEEGIWLVNLLCEGASNDPSYRDLDALAAEILRQARSHHSRSDDMSVGLVQIEAA